MRRLMPALSKSIVRTWLAALLVSTAALACNAVAEEKAGPIRALLITGGCCHDYDYQAKKLIAGSKQIADIEWTIEMAPERGTRGKMTLYDNPDWAKPYDVVVHNECFADTDEPEYIRKITSAHKSVPSVVIHCAMHTYRAAKIDDWREFLGVTSKHHEHQSEYVVTPTKAAAQHPIMKGFPAEWITPNDELYVIKKAWPNMVSLAESKSERTGDLQPVFWTNQYGDARVFGTTFGHGNATFNDGVFIRTVTRGLMWAAGRLDD